MTHLDRFLQERPELSLLSSLKDKEIDVLLWANKKGYIHLTSAPTMELCYSKHDYDVAFMWREKDES